MITIEMFNEWLVSIGLDIEVDAVEEVDGKIIGEVKIKSAATTDWFRFEFGNEVQARRTFEAIEGPMTEEDWEREWER